MDIKGTSQTFFQFGKNGAKIRTTTSVNNAFPILGVFDSTGSARRGIIVASLYNTSPSMYLKSETATQLQIAASNFAAGPLTFVFPPDAGSSGYVLSTDGAGNTSWIAMGGENPAPAGTPAMGTARSYALLAGTGAITNTGATVVSGNIGNTVGADAIGFPPGSFSGVDDNNNAAAIAAEAAASATYTDLTSRPVTDTPAAALDGQTLTAGVHYINSAATLTGPTPLTLSGSASDIIIIKINGALSVASTAVINLVGGVLPSNIYWAIAGAANFSLLANGIFYGNVITDVGAINTSGGTFYGSLITLAGGITLSAATNVITQSFEPSTALVSGNILIGNAVNVATPVVMSGEATLNSLGVVTLNDVAVISKALTGYASTTGTITGGDSILTAIEKLNGNIAAIADTDVGYTKRLI